MISRRQVVRQVFLAPAVASCSLALLWVGGCGPDEGLKAIPLNKTKEESQRESEQLPGIPVKDTKAKKRR